MKKFYYRLCQFIGYTIIFNNEYDSSFTLVKKNAYIGIYKYLGRWKHDNSLKMVRIWEIKIR